MNNIGQFPEIDPEEMKWKLIRKIQNNVTNNQFGRIHCYWGDKITAKLKNNKRYECDYCKNDWNWELSQGEISKSKLVKYLRLFEVCMWFHYITEDRPVTGANIIDLNEYFKNKALDFDEKLGFFIAPFDEILHSDNIMYMSHPNA